MGNIGSKVEIITTTNTETKPTNSISVFNHSPTESKTINEEKQKYYFTIGTFKVYWLTVTKTTEIIKQLTNDVVNHFN